MSVANDPVVDDLESRSRSSLDLTLRVRDREKRSLRFYQKENALWVKSNSHNCLSV